MLKNDFISECPVDTTLLLMGNRIKARIIMELLSGSKRHYELVRNVNMTSAQMLTQYLRDMEKTGLIERKVFAEVPSHVEYTLTDLGKSLEPVLKELERWGIEYQKAKKFI